MSQVPIKETSNDLLSRVGYWPGHVIAESLAIPEDKDKDRSNGNHLQTTVNKASENESSVKKTVNSTSTTPVKPGSAFSAIISSMLPIDLLTGASQPDDYIYDEFGFRLEREDEEKKNSDESTDFVNIRLSPVPQHKSKKSPGVGARRFVEDSKHKLKWIAYLEFTMNADLGSTFSWEQITSLNRCEKLRAMIRGQGVPHSLRSFIWMRLSGALEKKLAAKFKYADLFKNIEHDQYHTSKQIEKDLLRTLPSNICFASPAGVGIPRLRRILQALAWLYPSIGYCQGMGTVAASLLLFIEEEDAFWIMSAIIEDILPASYYSHTLLGVQADMKVLRQLIGTYLPRIDEKLREHDIELSLICINWFLTIFSNVFHMRILLRVWDLFFYEGSPALFQITLAMLKINEQALVDSQSSSQIFTILSDIPSEIGDIDELIETSIRIASSVNKSVLDVSRRKHQAYLMAQNGSIINPANYQSLPLVRERAQFRKLGAAASNALTDSAKSGVETKGKNLLKLIKRSFRNDPNNNNNNQTNKNSNNDSVKSLGSEELFGGDDNNEAKMKNIMQTELLVNLRDIILKIAHYFQARDPDMYNDVSLNADYSIESHTLDYERYMDTSKVKGFKRAKAILDFEKSDEDELGFKRNDIITVLSTKDDHCWIGELNGQKGWFPSRFVSLIDERNGKIYSSAGDDSVDERIRDMVRGELWLALKAIFEHGLKRFHVLGSTMHPWSFIEEAARKVVEKDFQSVYSRLVLCKTFRLDEDGKVLTPDELLFRSIKLINMSHDSFRANMDVKFRSLICIGLNEQVLHIWLETLCSSLETVEKWYHEWSFLRSPGWVQIKCELRILSQFSFLLNVDAELPDTKKDLAINECIKDMLVKHHLFSWEI